MSSPSSQDDRRSDNIGASAVVLVLALVSISLRFWSRMTSKSAGLWWDDWLALASVPFIIVSCSLSFWWTTLGLGLHVNQASGNLTQWLLILWIYNLTYNTGLSCVKLSVVLFYFRVFQHLRIYSIALWFTAFLVVAWFLGTNLSSIFQCSPVQSAWDKNIKGHCIASGPDFLGTAISNLVVDLVILLIPLPALWRLHVSRTRKLALTGVFICGYCVVVISIVRLVSIVQLGNHEMDDLTWVFVNPQLLVLIETPIALFSSCLPAIFQLFKRLYEKRRFGTTKTSKHLTCNPNIKMGPLGNPLDRKDGHDFERLPDQGDGLASRERLDSGTG